MNVNFYILVSSFIIFLSCKVDNDPEKDLLKKVDYIITNEVRNCDLILDSNSERNLENIVDAIHNHARLSNELINNPSNPNYAIENNVINTFKIYFNLSENDKNLYLFTSFKNIRETELFGRVVVLPLDKINIYDFELLSVGNVYQPGNITIYINSKFKNNSFDVFRRENYQEWAYSDSWNSTNIVINSNNSDKLIKNLQEFIQYLKNSNQL